MIRPDTKAANADAIKFNALGKPESLSDPVRYNTITDASDVLETMLPFVKAWQTNSTVRFRLAPPDAPCQTEDNVMDGATGLDWVLTPSAYRDEVARETPRIR